MLKTRGSGDTLGHSQGAWRDGELESLVALGLWQGRRMREEKPLTS